MKEEFYIYEWSINGVPFYIGKGKGGRFRKLNNRNPYTLHVHNQNKGQVVKRIIFDSLYEDESFILEQVLINHYGRRTEGTGCLTNLTDGGEGVSGYMHSDETKSNIGLAGKGRTISDDQKTKIVVSNRTRTISNETRAKMSAAKKGKIPHNYGKTGFMHSVESRLKMSATRKGITLSDEHKAKIAAANRTYWQKKKEQEYTQND